MMRIQTGDQADQMRIPPGHRLEETSGDEMPWSAVEDVGYERPGGVPERGRQVLSDLHCRDAQRIDSPWEQAQFLQPQMGSSARWNLKLWSQGCFCTELGLESTRIG